MIFEKKNLLSSFILIFIIIKSTNQSFFDNSVNKILYEYIESALEGAEDNVTSSCISSIKEIFPDNTDSDNFTDTEIEYLHRLFYYSTKQKNSLRTYESCISHTNESDSIQTKYLLVEIINKSISMKNTYLYPIKFFYGICIPKEINCTNDDFRSLIVNLNSKHEELLQVKSLEKNSIDSYIIDENSDEFKLKTKNIANFIPTFLIIIQALLTIFTGIPHFLTYKIYNFINKKFFSSEGNPLPKISFIEVKNSFSIKESSGELFISKTSSKFNNDSGMTFLKGVIGFNMIFLVIGNVFTTLVQSPAALYTPFAMKQLLKNGLFFIICYGCRYAPKILLSASGFSLMYKSMCYFDDKKQEFNEKQEEEEEEEEEEEDETQEIKMKNNVNNNQKLKRAPVNVIKPKKLDEDNEEEEEDEKEKLKDLKRQAKKTQKMLLGNDDKDKEKESKEEEANINNNLLNQITKHESIDSEIPVKDYIQFVFTQFHKYLISLLVIFFVRFNLYYLIMLFKSFSPLLTYFYKKVLGSYKGLDIALQIILINPFFSLTKIDDIFAGQLRDSFYLPFTEILCFFFTSVFIYVNYRNKYSIGDFAIFATIIIIIISIIIYVAEKEYFYPIQYFSHAGYGRFFIFPVYNYLFFLIGLYFGLVNYVFQKNISISEAEKTERDYLNKPIKIVRFYNKKSRKWVFITGVIIFLVIILFSYLHTIIMAVSGGNEPKKVVANIFTRIIFFIDNYIVVLLFNFAMFGFYSKGQNAVDSFFSSLFWSVFSKMYYSFILVSPIVSLYLFYNSDSRINITFGNIIYYSLISLIISFVLGSILYIIYELPYKRLYKFFHHFNRRSNEGKKNGTN